MQLPLLKTEHIPSFGNIPAQWMAYLENVNGMLVMADTEEKAIDELMISIKVQLLHKKNESNV